MPPPHQDEKRERQHALAETHGERGADEQAPRTRGRLARSWPEAAPARTASWISAWKLRRSVAERQPVERVEERREKALPSVQAESRAEPEDQPDGRARRENRRHRSPERDGQRISRHADERRDPEHRRHEHEGMEEALKRPRLVLACMPCTTSRSSPERNSASHNRTAAPATTSPRTASPSLRGSSASAFNRASIPAIRAGQLGLVEDVILHRRLELAAAQTRRQAEPASRRRDETR